MDIAGLIENVAAPFIFSMLSLVFGFLFGRRKNIAEIENLKSQQKVAEAEAGSIIAQAAAQIVGPLVERVRALQQEVNDLTEMNKQLKNRIEELETLVKTFLPKG